MTDAPRIIPPEEARRWADVMAASGQLMVSSEIWQGLAHTAAVLGEENAKLRASHTRMERSHKLRTEQRDVASREVHRLNAENDRLAEIYERDQKFIKALQHDLAVLGEQREAVLTLHRDDGDGYCVACVDWVPMTPAQAVRHPCPTRVALGVSDE